MTPEEEKENEEHKRMFFKNLREQIDLWENNPEMACVLLVGVEKTISEGHTPTQFVTSLPGPTSDAINFFGNVLVSIHRAEILKEQLSKLN